MLTTLLMIRQMYFGPWQLNFSDEADYVNPEQTVALERYLNEEYLPIASRQYNSDYTPNLALERWQVPSFAVRFDMPPMNEEVALYEVEANPAGFYLAECAGVPVFEQISDALRQLSIHEIGFGVAPSRSDQREEHMGLMRGLADRGIHTFEVGMESLPDVPLWLRAGQDDIEDLGDNIRNCLILHHDGGGHKKYLVASGRAKLLRDCPHPFHEYPDGFVVKALAGWGTKRFDPWCPHDPWKKGSTTSTKMANHVDHLVEWGDGGNYLVQPFLPPLYRDGQFRIWRLAAVWTPNGYRLIGGWWSERNSLRNHGANDTVSGPLFVQR